LEKSVLLSFESMRRVIEAEHLMFIFALLIASVAIVV